MTFDGVCALVEWEMARKIKEEKNKSNVIAAARAASSQTGKAGRSRSSIERWYSEKKGVQLKCQIRKSNFSSGKCQRQLLRKTFKRNITSRPLKTISHKSNDHARHEMRNLGSKNHPADSIAQIIRVQAPSVGKTSKLWIENEALNHYLWNTSWFKN